MTDTPRVFLAAYHDGLSPRYEVVPEGAMGAEPWIEEAWIMSDGQRLLRKCDVEGICDDPDLCFVEEESTVRCGPCAAKIAAAFGVELNPYTVGNPEAMRLRREMAKMVPEGAGVRVKALEWTPWRGDQHRQYAVTPQDIEYHADNKGWWLFLGRHGETDGIDAAKAAAQADYEARILAALELTTEPEPTSAEDAMTEIARLGQEWDAAPSPDPLAENMGLDAAKWAHEFRKIALRLGYSDMDEGWLIGWFANAIEYARRDKLPPDEGITTRLAALRETFCYASPGSDAEFTSLLLGFDTAAKVAVEAETSGYERGQDAAAIKMLAWLAKAVGGEDYVPCDGTETWDGDVHGTIYAILKAGKVYDDEDGRVAKLSHDWGTPTSGAYDLICCTAEDVATGRGFTGDAAADLAMAQESLRACLKLLGWRADE